MITKNIVSVSGGIDSATCLALAVKEYGKDNIIAIHYNYNQPTEAKELECAKKLTDYYGVDLIIKDIYNIIAKGGLAAADQDFTKPTREDGVSTGYVPFRNLMLLTIAASAGATMWPKAERLCIWIGPQKTDVAAYADCRLNFIIAASKALDLSMDAMAVDIITPLIECTKTEVVKKALDLGVPIEYTYSCYKMIDGKPCGTCGACEERISAFKELGVKDPVYA